MSNISFIALPVAGAWLVEPKQKTDERGQFARIFCAREFAALGLEVDFAQSNLCSNHQKGTIRGLHLQLQPHAEVKLVRCVHGSVFDVIVDLRPESDTYLKSYTKVLSAENCHALYIPQGFAHGYQTLTHDAVVHYMVSEFYTPAFEAGLRYDDPALAIAWPAEVTLVSAKDRLWPCLTGAGQKFHKA